MKNNWYEKSYRRFLIDMHIADTTVDYDWVGDDRFNGLFLSKLSAEECFANFKKANLDNVMIYSQSHAGHCFYPTKVGYMHSAFVGCEDKIKKLVDLCRNDGIKVVIYYSLIFNTYEVDRHPEWRIDVGTPRGRYGLCCPNNPDYRAFVKEQIKEISEYYTMDGMFYDMTFWPGNAPCQCEHCMKKYKEAGIDKIPEANYGTPEYKKIHKLRCEMIADFAKFVNEATVEYMPGVSIEHNYANSVAGKHPCCSTELVNEYNDYTGGDLAQGPFGQTFTEKYFYNVTNNQPFEYMVSRCDRSLQAHTVTKSEARLLSEVLLTTAHHGASMIIDAVDPIGTLDSRVYERVGKVYSKQIPYEKYFRGEMISDVAIYYSTTGRYNSHGFAYDSKTSSIAATRIMVEGNIPVGVISNAKTNTAYKYKMVLAPSIAGISDKNRSDLVNYVKNGGVLYISGVEEPELIREFFGAEYKHFTQEGAVYYAPTDAADVFGEFNAKYPLPTEMPLPVVEGFDKDTVVLATMTLPYTKKNERKFASIHANPPGVPTDIPALVEKSFGKGKVIWSACPLEEDDRPTHKQIFTKLIRKYLGETTVNSNAPRQVELVTFKSETEILISAVDLLCTDELLPIRDISISVKSDKAPTGVFLIKEGNELPIEYTYSDGRVNFEIKDLVMFDMYIIKL